MVDVLCRANATALQNVHAIRSGTHPTIHPTPLDTCTGVNIRCDGAVLDLFPAYHIAVCRTTVNITIPLLLHQRVTLCNTTCTTVQHWATPHCESYVTLHDSTGNDATVSTPLQAAEAPCSSKALTRITAMFAFISTSYAGSTSLSSTQKTNVFLTTLHDSTSCTTQPVSGTPTLTFISSNGLGLMALTPCPTFRTA